MRNETYEPTLWRLYVLKWEFFMSCEDVDCFGKAGQEVAGPAALYQSERQEEEEAQRKQLPCL